MSLLLALLLFATSPAQAEICGKYMECGIFSGPDILQPSKENPVQIRIFEFQPNEITIISLGHDKITDYVPIRFKFDGSDGHFYIYYMGFMDVGEGSCANMICQFKADDSKWPFAEDRPPVQLSGTLSFANRQISRIELRKLEGETPLFVTGVMASLCADPALRSQMSPGSEVTEESCFYFLQNKTNQMLKGVIGGTGKKPNK